MKPKFNKTQAALLSLMAGSTMIVDDSNFMMIRGGGDQPESPKPHKYDAWALEQARLKRERKAAKKAQQKSKQKTITLWTNSKKT